MRWPAIRDRIPGAVSSSEASSARLRAHGIEVFDANAVESIPVYIDGADEIDPRGHMIKGGGAALTREKIVADLAARFVCIADGSKRVEVLGRFPLPIEVIPMAGAQIARRVARARRRADAAARAGRARSSPTTAGTSSTCAASRITDPLAMETQINQWPGVVTVGLFARNKAIGVPARHRRWRADTDFLTRPGRASRKNA